MEASLLKGNLKFRETKSSLTQLQIESLKSRRSSKLLIRESKSIKISSGILRRSTENFQCHNYSFRMRVKLNQIWVSHSLPLSNLKLRHRSYSFPSQRFHLKQVSQQLYRLVLTSINLLGGLLMRL